MAKLNLPRIVGANKYSGKWHVITAEGKHLYFHPDHKEEAKRVVAAGRRVIAKRQIRKNTRPPRNTGGVLANVRDVSHYI